MADWQARGACKGKINHFFPSRGESVAHAKKICAECPVQGECLEYALENSELFGVWGGMSERQRQRIRVANPRFKYSDDPDAVRQRKWRERQRSA